MRIGSAVAVLALWCAGGVVGAGESVLQVTVSASTGDAAPRSQFAEGAYRATGVSLRGLLSDAFDANSLDVWVLRGGIENKNELFDVSIDRPGANTAAIRATLRGVVESLVGGEIRVFDEQETVYDVIVVDPARMPRPRIVLNQESRMTNIDRVHFDIECKGCTVEWLASLADMTMPSPKLVVGGLLRSGGDGNIGEVALGEPKIRWDFECHNCTVESLMTYLRDAHGFTVTPREATVRYVQVTESPADRD